MCRKCVNEWEWLDRAPQVRMLKEPTRRIRFLTRDEAQHVLAELPDHLADMAAFSLATGLRAFNVTGLQWTEVDLTRRLAWVHPDQAKARKAIPVPLNAEAVSLVRKQLGKHLTHVFSFRGKPSTQVSTKAWYGALERAGISNFRWHDLRHTWASWHVQSGTPFTTCSACQSRNQYHPVTVWAQPVTVGHNPRLRRRHGSGDACSALVANPLLLRHSGTRFQCCARGDDHRAGWYPISVESPFSYKPTPFFELP
jgi:hypothetical protein